MSKAAFFFLCVYILLVFIRPQEFVTFLNDVPIVIVFELLALACWLGVKKQLNLTPVVAVALLTLCIAVSWVSLSVNIGIEKTMSFIFGQALVLILVSSLADSVKRHEVLFNLTILAALVMSLHAVGQISSVDKIGWTGVQALVRNDSGDVELWQARYLGIFGDPNDMGMLLAAAVPLLVYKIWKTQRTIAKAAWVIALLVILEGVYLCNSRGTILAIIAPAALYFMIRYNVFKAIVPFILLFFVVILVAPTRLFISNDQSSQDRIDAWYQGYLMFKSHPVFGVGMGNFMDYHHKTAHNSWVLAFSELGIVGFYFWMLMIMSAVYALYVIVKQSGDIFQSRENAHAQFVNEKRIATATFYSFIAILTAAFFLSRTYSFLLYFYSGLAAASAFRMTRDFSNITIPSIKLKTLIASVLFIVLIVLIVIVKS